MIRWLRFAAVGASNVARVVLLSGLRNWGRNLRTASPALASIGLLLVSTGMCAIAWTALSGVVRSEARSAAILHVYLADGASDDSVVSLEERLKALPGVRQVTYLSSDDALRRARARPALGLLLEDDTSSPFPAQLDVTVASVDRVGAVAAAAGGDPAVDTAYPTSYDGDAYRRLRSALQYAQLAGGAFLAVLLVVALAVCANSIRSSLLARQEEIRIMWLVGSPAWVMRSPFLVEGALTGALAAAFAAGLLGAALLTALHAQPVAIAQFLPGIDAAFTARLAAAILVVGASVGSGSTLLGLRGLRQ